MADNSEVKKWTEKSGEFSTPGRARTTNLHKEMKAAEKGGYCIFCRLEKLKGVIQEMDYWVLKPNDAPYKNHQLHLVIIWHPKRGHLEDIQAVPQEAWMS